LLGVTFLPAKVKTAAFRFGVGAWDASWRVGSAGVAGRNPALPLVSWAGFGIGLRDTAALVFWTVEDLCLRNWLAG
jgi:hypothetical protein